MKILNLYAGIGGNRKLWEDVEVTAVENNPFIAEIYHDFFPKDKIVIQDAHQYLLDHFEEYDFIWSSPPCPSHSRARFWGHGKDKPIYPNMKLYEEILLLKHYFKGKWCVENVIGYYEPLIKPNEISRHYIWANFHIRSINIESFDIHLGNNEKGMLLHGFDISKYQSIDKKTILRNCVRPELGLHILNESKKDIQGDLFRCQKSQ